MTTTSQKPPLGQSLPSPEIGDAPLQRVRRKRDPERVPPSLRRWAKADAPQTPEPTRFKRDW